MAPCCWARKAGANALAAAIAERHPEWTLKSRFALWHGVPSQAVPRCCPMACIGAFRDRDGRHLLALEANGGIIRIWDPVTRSLVGDGIEVSEEWIRSLAAMPTRERGDVLVVNVNTRPEPEQSESMLLGDPRDEESDDPFVVDEDDDSPFDDSLRNRRPSGKRRRLSISSTPIPANRLTRPSTNSLIWSMRSGWCRLHGQRC